MIWTHKYDLAIKIVTLVICAFIIYLITTLEIPALEDRGMLIALPIIGLGIIFYALFFRTIGTYLYCRLVLKMKIGFKQSAALNNAFAPNPFTNLKWLPMIEIRGLDDDKKYEVALTILKNWENDNTKKRTVDKNDYKNQPTYGKLLYLVMFAIIIFSFLASLLEIPPATYLIQYYCKIFDTQEYSPVLIGAILTFVGLFPVLGIKKCIDLLKK
jgi:hypothetical protein